MNPNFTRRHFLHGLGTCISLPFMESIAGAQETAARPLRMAYVYIPNGVNTENWRLKSTGSLNTLSPTLSPLEPVKSDIQVLSGLTHDKARANGDGGGDHARANATFLTGCQARKTAGADIQIGVSVDQIAAAQVGQFTRLPSLELSCDAPRRAGSCDSGYSCSYQFNLSWKSESSPMSPERSPRAAFDRLFGNQLRGEEEKARAVRDYYNKSILDFVQEDTRNLRKYLGKTDKGKLDEYLTTIRDLERRLTSADKFAASEVNYDRPSENPDNYSEHMRTMYDIMALAFQTDSTRISTFLLAHDGSNRSFNEVGVSEGHHSLSHHQNNKQKLEKIAKIDRFYVENFTYFVEKLKSIPDGQGTLLDNCMVVYGGGIADGNKHAHDDLPVILAGGGGGTLKTGRHVRFDDETPMTNLYLSMLDRMGVEANQLGDSTGKLRNI